MHVAVRQTGAQLILAARSDRYLGHTAVDHMASLQCLQADYTGLAQARETLMDLPTDRPPTILVVDTDGATTQRALSAVARTGGAFA